MLLLKPYLFISSLVATTLLEASPAIANPLPSTLTSRATKKQGCAGDYDGSSIGVLACADVTFNDFNSITIDLTVRDSKGDSNSVYGWFRVYGPDGYNIDLPRSGHLRNSLGYGHTVSALGLKWDQGVGKITGFRAKACVDDAGSDTCVDGPFIAAP